MPSFTTVFRAFVMIVTGVVAVKGWQTYGPPAATVKSIAVAALEKAQTALRDTTQHGAEPPGASSSLPSLVDSSAVPLPVVQESGNAPAPIAAAPELIPLAGAGADPQIFDSTAPMPSATPVATPAGPIDDSVARLLSRLEEMGAHGAEVGPWGSSGQLFRCYCRAKVEATSPMVRHFEAVADAPTDAVEQVVAKVEAWRTEQQAMLR